MDWSWSCRRALRLRRPQLATPRPSPFRIHARTLPPLPGQPAGRPTPVPLLASPAAAAPRARKAAAHTTAAAAAVAAASPQTTPQTVPTAPPAASAAAESTSSGAAPTLALVATSPVAGGAASAAAEERPHDPLGKPQDLKKLATIAAAIEKQCKQMAASAAFVRDAVAPEEQAAVDPAAIDAAAALLRVVEPAFAMATSRVAEMRDAVQEVKDRKEEARLAEQRAKINRYEADLAMMIKIWSTDGGQTEQAQASFFTCTTPRRASLRYRIVFLLLILVFCGFAARLRLAS